MIAVYGNRDYDDTLLEMKDILTERGFTVIAGLAAIAQHSIDVYKRQALDRSRYSRPVK